MSSASTIVSSRLPIEIRNKAAGVFAESGLCISDSIHALCRYLASHDELPFPILSNPQVARADACNVSGRIPKELKPAILDVAHRNGVTISNVIWSYYDATALAGKSPIPLKESAD